MNPKRYTVRENGREVYSTWVKSYWNGKMYMADGRVFSTKTLKQLPYALNGHRSVVEVH